MNYIDTSVLAAYYCPEPLSQKAEQFLINNTRPGISVLTEVELFSVLSRKVREGSLDRSDAGRIISDFLIHLDGHFYTSIPLTTRHCRLARDWIGQFHTSLKSLDAIHLAIAASERMTIVTADLSLAKSADLLAVDCVLLEV